MSMPKEECECNYDSIQRQLDRLDTRLSDAWKDRERIRKQIRILLAILVDKKLVGEKIAEAFMESKELKEAFVESTKVDPKIIEWYEAKTKFWIKKAKIKKGALRSQLGIKEGETIPKSILSKIAKAEVGTKVSFKGKSITVTAQLKKRASLALSFGKMKK